MSKLEVYFLGHSGFAIELNDKLLKINEQFKSISKVLNYECGVTVNILDSTI